MQARSSLRKIFNDINQGIRKCKINDTLIPIQDARKRTQRLPSLPAAFSACSAIQRGLQHDCKASTTSAPRSWIETVGRFHITELSGWSPSPELAQILACLRARTLPPKAPHSSSEWPPGESVRRLLSRQRGEAKLPTNIKVDQGCQKSSLFPPS